MTNLPTTSPPTETATPPAPTTPFSEPWLSNLRRGLGRRNGYPILKAGFEPTKEQRELIRSHHSTLTRQLTAGPDERQTVGLFIAKLLASYPAQKGGGYAAASLKVSSYEDAIGTAPVWAVKEAVLRVNQGKIPDISPDFAPTPARFAQIVAETMEPLRRDLADLRWLATLEAERPEPEISDEQAARMRARLKALAEELRASSEPVVDASSRREPAPEIDPEPESIEAMCRRYGVDPAIGVSPALLDTLEADE